MTDSGEWIKGERDAPPVAAARRDVRCPAAQGSRVQKLTDLRGVGPALAEKLLQVGASDFEKSIEPAELAARTMVASTILTVPLIAG